ncbi:MAG: dTDP-4-dehydrorhamnose 3,5-epimerase [Pseudomonadota bacterium]
MKFTQTDLQDAVLIDIEPRDDARGFFSRMFCEKEFAEAGLVSKYVQHNYSFNHKRGTLRGMHYQNAPHREVKVVQCVKGAIYDVIVDIRPASPTYLLWRGFELSENNRRQLYVPEGFAHGYVTLEDDSAVSYLVSAFYAPGAEGGLRWSDPAIGIDWPLEPDVISDKDASWPDFKALA